LGHEFAELDKLAPVSLPSVILVLAEHEASRQAASHLPKAVEAAP
jgi:hypothetical protein